MQGAIGPVHWVLNADDLRGLLKALKAAEVVSFDTETTGLDEHSTLGGSTNDGVAARVSMATFTIPDGTAIPPTWVLPLSHPQGPFLGVWRYILRRVAEVMLKHNWLVGQNLKFDLRWVYAHTGVDLSARTLWDTQVSSHLLDETTSTRLKERAPATFGIERWDDDVDLTKPGASERTDIWVLGDYAARDTFWTWKLAERHMDEMFIDSDERPNDRDERESARLGMLAQWCAMPMVASLARIEMRGFALDTEWVNSELILHRIGRDTALEEMAQRYGQDPYLASAAATSNWFKEYTRRAIEAGDLRITALTDTGNPQWNKSVLKRQARRGSRAAEVVLEQRDHAKKAEFLQAWADRVTPVGNIHTTYHAGRVVTGRLSSSDPNMQQVTKTLKPAFTPRPGFAIIDIDYSQIELRVAAFVSRCIPMIRAFQNGEDLHIMMGSAITNKPLELVTADERQGGKSANFGLLYGMQAEGFQEYAEDVYDVHFTLPQAYEVRQAFFDLWEGIEEWHERVRQEALANLQVVSPIGRVRRVPDIQSHNFYKSSYAERQAINSPVQGFASDIMQMAAASIQGLLPGTQPVADAYLVATVHDDIVLEAPIDQAERVALECQARMVNIPKVLAKLGCDFDIPLLAEASIGSRWGLKDLGYIE